MKSLTTSMMLATAAWMIASTTAFAADIKFEIPFAFRAVGTVLAPGVYRLRTSPGEVQFSLLNARTGKQIFMNAQASVDPRKEWSTLEGGVMQFACGDNECTLTQVWTHGGFPAHAIANPDAQHGKPARLALIRAVNSK